LSLERTLTIIKPDGVKQRNIGDIIKILEENQFKIQAAKMLHLTRGQAEGFYAVHRERKFFNDLTRYMCSGPILVLVLEGEDAISRLRDLMGATDPQKAAEGTIRKRYATSIEQNVIHGSDGPDSAKTEISYFFNALELVQAE
jgi:nucleoside-diphosphate kinase